MATIAQQDAQEVATVSTEKKQLLTFQTSPTNDSHYTDRVEALRLIADSVAQQRQDASRAIITNPITIAAVVGLCAALSHYFNDVATIVATTAGCLMAGMAGVGYWTYGYLDLAEKTGTWSFLRPAGDGKGGEDREEDVLLVTKYGDEVIGALVLRLLLQENSNSNSNSKKKSSKRTKAVIRAWTVKRRYRHKGIGSSLLEEAIALCQKMGWEGPEFASDHANSKRILPKMLQKNLDRGEEKARTHHVPQTPPYRPPNPDSRLHRPPLINENGLNLIKSFESFQPSEYDDGFGNPTIGYGHECADTSCSDVPFAQPLTEDSASQLLASDLVSYQDALTNALADPVALNDNQYAALVSWTYNIGNGNMANSDLVSRMNAGEDVSVVAHDELPQWNKANGQVVDGLTRRRAAELALFDDADAVNGALPVPC